jgi:hypothetical protein
MKDLYSKKIDSSKYQTIQINNNTSSYDGSSGVVFLPYIFKEHTEESLLKYNQSAKLYKIEHECCPKCGATEHSSTLVAYIGNDLNRCKCFVCGDEHVTHDRISKELFTSRLIQVNK